MNILLPTIGSAGDVYPMIALGRMLQQRGHRVTIVTNPLHQQTILHAGLHFHPLGTRVEAEELLANPDVWHPRRGFETIARGAILPAMRLLYEFIAGQDSSDMVIGAQTMALGARLAQEKLGVPLATIHLQPSLLRSVYDPPINGVAIPTWLPRPLKRGWWAMVDSLVIDRVLATDLNAFRAELGLPPVKRPFHEWLHSPQRVLGLFPDWFAPPQPDWPSQTRLTGFPLYDAGEGSPLPADLQRFLAVGDPPLVFTFGSAMRHGDELFRVAIAATKQRAQRAVLLTRDRSQLPATLPPTIHHEPYVPLGDLLPHTALLVHHGGIGTVAQGLAAGIPQLVMPLSHDQPDNARRLERLGVGLSLSSSRLGPAAVSSAIDSLLSSSEIKARCEDLARRVDARQAREAAASFIEQLARSPSPANVAHRTAIL